jgi:hypothetical protein
LSPQRIEVLNYIDFLVWDPLDARWNEVFERLVEYTKKKNGSTMAAQNYKQDPELGSWVVQQRRLRKKKAKRLSEERIDKLDSIGFVWAPIETSME